MNWWTLATAVLGGTALATLMGKLLDMWLLEPQRAKSERARWLREARLEAFAQLSSELLSFGIKSGAAIDFQKLRALSARSELLIDDPALLTDLRAFMSDMFNWNMDGLPGTKTPAARGVTLVKAERR